ncbi:MAG: GNAT family N-acetyltransferase [Gammaproteobacteria bacterium]|nr:GNAT family N-acetyltransferase [Gammaproteobacteria bacterium]
MKADSLVENGWALAAPRDADIDELMGWFPDTRSVDIWGGPRFRYPFTHDSFRTDCRLDEMLSYCLRDPDGAMVGFGQVYDRCDRGHLARLIIHPNMRRQGIGKRLIEMLVEAAQQSCGHNEYSLFVYRDNEPAFRCYLAMGFVLQDYPDDAPMKERCYFLTR